MMSRPNGIDHRMSAECLHTYFEPPLASSEVGDAVVEDDLEDQDQRVATEKLTFSNTCAPTLP